MERQNRLDKNGHSEKHKPSTNKKGNFNVSNELAYCARRFAKRMPADGKK